ncbi:PDZK1-interacting protein 1 [Menidia menidia]
MGKLSVLLSRLLLLGGAMAQTALPGSGQRLLPQWLTGIIAVVCFLLLTFIAFLVKKVWCEDPSRRRGSAESVKENEYATRDPYDTQLEAMRKRGSTESDKGQNQVCWDTYDTGLDGPRNKDSRNVYTNMGVDSSEERVTPM